MRRNQRRAGKGVPTPIYTRAYSWKRRSVGLPCSLGIWKRKRKRLSFEVRSSPANPKSLMIGFRPEINSGVAFRVRETHCRYDHAFVRKTKAADRSRPGTFLSRYNFSRTVNPVTANACGKVSRIRLSISHKSRHPFAIASQIHFFHS